MNISTDLLANLGLGALSFGAETELTIPPAVLLTTEARQPAQNLNGTIGATINQTTICTCVVDQTNVVASSRMLFRLKKGLWRIRAGGMKSKNFAGVQFASDWRICLGYDAAGADAQDILRDGTAGPTATNAFFPFYDAYHLVGNQDLIITEFEETTVGAGNRCQWVSSWYIQKIL